MYSVVTFMMKLFLQLLVANVLLYCHVSGQYSPPRPCGCGGQGSVYDPSPNSPVYNVLSPNSCSYNTGCGCDVNNDEEDVGSTRSCSCQSGDQTCNCVLGCGCTLTGDNECADVNLINKTFSDVLSGGPYKILAIWDSQETAQIDNVCYTYFAQTGTDSAVVYISRVFIDGTNEVETYIVHDGGPGVVQAGGSVGVIKDKTFGEVEGCAANTVYRCYLWGDYVSPANRDYQYPTFVIGPLCANRDSSCGRRAAQALIDAGYNQKYRILPENLPYRCVMSQPSTPTANTCSNNNYPCYQ